VPESKEQRQAKVRERVAALLASALRPGEQVRTIVPAQRRPRGTYGLEFVVVLGMLAAIRWYVIALTDRRFFLLDCGRSSTVSNVWRPQSIVWDEPLEGVRLLDFRHGLLYTRLGLARLGGSEEIHLRAGRFARAETNALASALGGVSIR
jgi:hypothetical protein